MKFMVRKWTGMPEHPPNATEIPFCESPMVNGNGDSSLIQIASKHAGGGALNSMADTVDGELTMAT